MDAAGGPDHLIGVYIEAIQALTGEVLSDAAWDALCAWRDRTGVPLVLSETCSAFGRSGRGWWWLDQARHEADVVLWWAGGQIGHIFSRPSVFVAKPLTLISTWDGDELSATRLLWQLYATRELTRDAAVMSEISSALEASLSAHFSAVSGVGLYRVVKTPHAAALQNALGGHQIQVQHLGDHLCFAPPVTTTLDEVSRFSQALATSLKGLA